MVALTPFLDRAGAGRLLAERLSRLAIADPIVIALPRGGVPVAVEVGKTLHSPVDLLLVRKIGVPWQPELAAAAIVDGQTPDLILNDEVLALAGIDRETVQELARAELAEIERRRKAYLQHRAPIQVSGRSVVLVDDGIATGTSVRAALTALRRRGAKRIVLAVPVAPAETLKALAPLVDEIVCLATPEPFYAIGSHYRDFHQLSDEEVVSLLPPESEKGFHPA